MKNAPRNVIKGVVSAKPELIDISSNYIRTQKQLNDITGNNKLNITTESGILYPNIHNKIHQVQKAQVTTSTTASKPTSIKTHIVQPSTVNNTVPSPEETYSGVPLGYKKQAAKKHLRCAAGMIWNDPTLEDWPASM